jgi:predicted nuclease of predicted toxin-antitoxin system
MSPDFPLIIADESVDARIVQGLIDGGFSIYSITKESPGITDTQIIGIAVEKKGFIITEDKDFGDELVFKRVQNIGSLLLRISDLPIESKIHMVVEVITLHAESMLDSFSVLTSKKLRIRKY